MNVYKILATEVFITLLFIIFENMKTYSKHTGLKSHNRRIHWSIITAIKK